jgi:hypothetical protein
MVDNVKELTPKQLGAIRSLLTKHSIPDAARDAKVTPTTIYRWLDEPTFRMALTVAEGQAIDAATRRLVSLSEAAVAVIASVMADRTVHPSTRLRAAVAVLDSLLKLRELRNIEMRLAALEQRTL